MTAIKPDTFLQSLERCRKDEKFMERFYEHFMASSPAIREKFAKTDWQRQYRMIVESFEIMVQAQARGTENDPELWRIAVLHGDHGHKILGWMYENWLESLLKAVKETDPQYDEDIDLVWHRTMSQGIAFMKARRFEKP